MNTVNAAKRAHIGLAIVLAMALPAGVVCAQSTKSTDSTSSNSAVNTDTAASGGRLVAPSALVKGANSFTEGEARSRLERAGLSDVTDLKKDDAGIWRGKAKHGDKSVSVGLDFKGDISAE